MRWLIASASILGLVLSGFLVWIGRERPNDAPAPMPEHPFVASIKPTEPAPTVGEVEHGAPTKVRRGHVVIPSIGVDAAMTVVGKSGVGAMTLPEDISIVGLADFAAPLKSEQGASLIAGHVDNYALGNGALWGIHLLNEGALVYTSDQDGSIQAWRVSALRSYVKVDLPQDLSRKVGERVLNLVTCGGPINAGNYRDNVVATAVSVPYTGQPSSD